LIYLQGKEHEENGLYFSIVSSPSEATSSGGRLIFVLSLGAGGSSVWVVLRDLSQPPCKRRQGELLNFNSKGYKFSVQDSLEVAVPTARQETICSRTIFRKQFGNRQHKIIKLKKCTESSYGFEVMFR